MSIIIGVRKNEKTVMVSDTFSGHSGLMSTAHKCNNEKIYRIGQTLVGLVGPSVNHNIFESLLHRYPEKLKFTDGRSIFESIRSLHKVLRDEYYINISTEEDESAESSQLDLLIVNSAGIFEVENHREVNKFDKFWAIGSGATFALGALSALYDCVEDAAEIARRAAEAACSFDSGCGLPIQELTLGGRGSARRKRVDLMKERKRK